MNKRAKYTNSTYHRFRRTLQSHGTSIWNESLYKAWGSILNSLIPNLNIIESILSHLMEVTGADEVVLFERTTFLKVMSVQSEVGEENPHEDRFERLSSIIKIFKASISCVFHAYQILLERSTLSTKISSLKTTPSPARICCFLIFD